MFPVDQLSIVQPHLVQPGTVLLGGAQYNYPPMFVFEIGEEKFRFDFDTGKEGFTAMAMAINLSRYFHAGEATVLVDLASTVSPTRSDIPLGSVVLIGDTVCFAIKINYGTAYVTLEGALLEDPRSYENIVAFAKWKIVVPALDDEWHMVYEAQ